MDKIKRILAIVARLAVQGLKALNRIDQDIKHPKSYKLQKK